MLFGDEIAVEIGKKETEVQTSCQHINCKDLNCQNPNCQHRNAGNSEIGKALLPEDSKTTSQLDLSGSKNQAVIAVTITAEDEMFN